MKKAGLTPDTEYDVRPIPMSADVEHKLDILESGLYSHELSASIREGVRAALADERLAVHEMEQRELADVRARARRWVLGARVAFIICGSLFILTHTHDVIAGF